MIQPDRTLMPAAPLEGVAARVSSTLSRRVSALSLRGAIAKAEKAEINLPWICGSSSGRARGGCIEGLLRVPGKEVCGKGSCAGRWPSTERHSDGDLAPEEGVGGSGGPWREYVRLGGNKKLAPDLVVP